MYDIDWTKIKNGSRGFEDLAREYVKDTFHVFSGSWKDTPQTHDGNKDAFAVIIGYKPTPEDNEIWWMEAKYSAENDSKICLSRFRLDATIVSSLFYDNVTKIIFVTNINIKAKVISEIRIALSMATRCQNVYFCTKKILEYWLYSNKDIYNDFFSVPLSPITETNELFVSEDISVYRLANHMKYANPLLTIASNTKYYAYFKIISTCQQTIKITSGQTGIKRLSKIEEKLKEGENIICVKFLVKNNFFKNKQYTYDGLEKKNLCLFKINKKLPVMLQQNIDIVKNSEYPLEIESQNKLLNAVQKYKARKEATFWFVNGNSGVGKTFAIENSLEGKKEITKSFYKFCNDTQINAINVINALFFVLLPFVYSEDITEDYIESLPFGSVKKNLQIIVSCYKDTDLSFVQEKLIEIVNLRLELIPDNLFINPRILVFDDIHLAEGWVLKFMMYVLCQFEKLPLLVILSGQPLIIDTIKSSNIVQMPVFYTFHFDFSTKDAITNLNFFISFPFQIESELIEYFFPNIVVFKLFIEYIQLLKDEIISIDQFIIAYISFKKNYFSSKIINEQFNEIFTQFPEAGKLCERIYTENKVSTSAVDASAATVLFSKQLIKYDIDNALIPVHDIYLQHFRRKKNILINTDNSLTQLTNNIMMTQLYADIELAYQKIYNMRCSEEFYTITYILEGIYETPEKDDYRKLWGNELYYLLYYEYAYSAINCSQSVSGYEHLEIICKGIYDTESDKLACLKLNVLYELMLNCYYNLEYSKCRDLFQEYDKYLELLIKKGIENSDKLQNLHYILCTNLIIVIDSEENKEDVLEKAIERKNFLKEKYFHHYIDFLIQFAQTLYVYNWDLAINWINEAYFELSNNTTNSAKQRLKINSKRLFALYIESTKGSDLRLLKEQILQMKHQYYSSYRHMVFLYCAVLYMLNDVESADIIFLKTTTQSRPMSNKMKGFYYQLFALYYLKHQQINESIHSLDTARKLFKENESYLQIIDHNYKLLKNDDISKIKYAFCKSLQFDSQTYYIDPRMY